MKSNLQQGFLIVILVLTVGCSSLNQRPQKQELHLERQWALSTLNKPHLGYRHAHQMAPALVEDLVIQGNSVDGIVAIQREKAQTQWALKIPNGVASGVQTFGDRSFFGASDGHFYAVETFTGRLSWMFPTRVENLAGPLVQDKTVYFLSGNDTVYALNTDTGQQRWLYTRTSQVDLSVRGGTQPAIYNKVLFVGFSDGYLGALHIDDGSLLWERQLGTGPKFRDIDSSPYVDDKFIYVSSFDNALYCLSRQDGQIVWRVEEGGAFPVTVQGETLFYSTSNGKVKAINRQTGDVLWTKKIEKGIATRPVFFEGKLAYGESAGPLRIVDAKTGSDIAHYNTGRGIASAPAVDLKTGQILAMSNDGNLFSFALVPTTVFGGTAARRYR